MALPGEFSWVYKFKLFKLNKVPYFKVISPCVYVTPESTIFSPAPGLVITLEYFASTSAPG